MVPKKHNEPKPDQDQSEEENHDEDRGGFSLTGPFGFSAKFPASAAGYSYWIVLAIAAALIILSTCYGWSLIK